MITEKTNIEFLNQIKDADGVLIPIEFKDLPFIPKRIFIVKNVPINTTRGNHAHYKTQQLLICLKGLIEVMLFDGKIIRNFKIVEGQKIFIDKMIWDSQTFLSEDATLLSICSTPYDPADYINDIEEFKRKVS